MEKKEFVLQVFKKDKTAGIETDGIATDRIATEAIATIGIANKGVATNNNITPRRASLSYVSGLTLGTIKYSWQWGENSKNRL